MVRRWAQPPFRPLMEYTAAAQSVAATGTTKRTSSPHTCVCTPSGSWCCSSRDGYRASAEGLLGYTEKKCTSRFCALLSRT